MGREIRRVPPNWEHPESEDNYGRRRPQPMHDETFDAAWAKWLADFDRIRSGDLDDTERECYPRGLADWLQDYMAPDPAYYRPWRDDEATWFQVWQTVSEGSPVSPPFATKDELIDYLAKHGDFWDQDRCHKPDWQRLWGGTPGVSAWGRERAERFVNAEWASSMVVMDGRVMGAKADALRVREADHC